MVDAAAGQQALTAAETAAAAAGAATPCTTQEASLYNPRPTSPLPARITITPIEPYGDGTPRISATVTVQETAGASSLSSVATLCNSAIGAGVLSLPFAFKCAGLAGGLVLCALVAAAESFSLYILSKFAERYDAHSYGSLVRRALGRKLSSVLSLITLLYLFGSCIAYLIIIGDNFSSLAQAAFGAHLATGREFIIAAVALVVILPMCFARSLSALEWVSAGAVVGFAYTSIAIVWRGAEAVVARPDHWAGVQLWKPWGEALYAISILVFGFNSSANTVSIFSELDPYPHRLVVLLPPSPREYSALHTLAPRPYTYKLIGMIGVILVSMSLIAAGYVAVGIAGYAAFPLDVSSNILNTFPANDAVMQVARGVIGVMVVGHWPLNHMPARLAFADLMATFFDLPDVPAWGMTAFTLAFVAVSLASAMVVDNLGTVLHLIGGTAATFMVFFLPGLLCWNAAVIKATASYPDLAQAAGGTDGPAGSTPPRSPSRPLLVPKKAGLRSEGLLFLSHAKTWWAGLVLVVISLGVAAITLITAAGSGGGH